MLAALLLAALLLAPAGAQAAGKKAASGGDTTPPKITHTAVDEAPAGKVLTVSATITDESEIFEPTLYYRAAGTKRFLSASMSKGAGSVYTATIPEVAMTGVVEYFIEAYDVNGNGPARFASDKVPHKIKTRSESVKVAEAKPEPKPAETKPAEVKPAETKPAEPAVATTGTPAGVERKSESRGKIIRIAGIAIAGVGAGGLVAGTVLGLKSKSLRNDAVADPTASGAQSKYDSAKKMALGTDVAFAVGGVLAAAGVVLAILPSFTSFGGSDSGERSMESSLSVGPTGATLTVHF
jgi:hypothetical protein